MRPSRTLSRLALCVVLALPVACATTPEGRMRNAERKAMEADEALGKAEKALEALKPDDAADALEDAADAVDDPDTKLHPEHELLGSRLAEARAKLPVVKAAREKQELDAAVDEARDEVVTALAKVRETRTPLEKGASDKAAVAAADDALDDLEEALEDAEKLEAKDPDYAGYATSARKELGSSREEHRRAGWRLDFFDGPGAGWVDGSELEKRAAKEKGEPRTALRRQALAAYRRCAEDGAAKLKDNAELAREPSDLPGLSSIGAVVKACEKRVRELGKSLPPEKAAKGDKPAKAKGSRKSAK